MRLAAAVTALALVSSVFAQSAAIDWINSPEAYFATAEERAEWFRLKDDAEREAFKERYWLMRDPTPETPKNEFKEVILDRIRKADAKFSIKDGASGSQTAQGMVYIVFGPPATIRTAPGGGVLVPVIINGRAVSNTMTEPTDVTTTWIYDTHRTPRLLEMLGRPGLEITIVIEPTRRQDVLQTPGLFDQYREVLAKRSVVNPQGNVISALPAGEITASRLNVPLPDSIRALLREASPVARSADGVVFSTTELWNPKQNSTLAVFSVAEVEDRTAHLMTYGEIRAGDRVVATIAQPFVTATGLGAANGARSEVLRLDLPPGTYESAFVLVDDRIKQPLLSVATPLRVLDATAKFDVSSLLLAEEPKTGKSEFTFGQISVRPRADLLYQRSESMWYFAVIRSEAGLNGITTDIQLRRDGKPIAARTFTPRMDAIAPGLFLLGEELPLGRLSTGDYSLYVVVHGAAGATEVRRADFRIGS